VKKPPAWSYSSITLFEQCPKKYYHLRVAKDIKEPDSEAMMYGKDVHLAAENFMRDGTPLPEKYAFMRPMLDKLQAIPGDKHCELKMGLKKVDGRLMPCDFFAKDVWWRGIADLLIINEEKQTAYLVDYKTSKNAKYADTKQLDLLAGAVFTHYPKVMEIKSALLFVVSNEIVKKKHEFMMRLSYLNSMEPELTRLEAAIKTNVWNPVSSPLCKFCPVASCTHNRRS
jgi:hypothetical protein